MNVVFHGNIPHPRAAGRGHSKGCVCSRGVGMSLEMLSSSSSRGTQGQEHRNCTQGLAACKERNQTTQQHPRRAFSTWVFPLGKKTPHTHEAFISLEQENHPCRQHLPHVLMHLGKSHPPQQDIHSFGESLRSAAGLRAAGRRAGLVPWGVENCSLWYPKQISRVTSGCLLLHFLASFLQQEVWLFFSTSVSQGVITSLGKSRLGSN